MSIQLSVLVRADGGLRGEGPAQVFRLRLENSEDMREVVRPNHVDLSLFTPCPQHPTPAFGGLAFKRAHHNSWMGASGWELGIPLHVKRPVGAEP